LSIITPMNQQHTKKFFTLSLMAMVFLVSVFFTNCRKDKINLNNNFRLGFSSDTVLFDTLFTTMGSTTKYIRVYNSSNQKVVISNIILEQGTQSPYRINVDGQSGVSFEEVEIPANDSIFIFVQVTIDPNGLNTPLLVEDKIKFITNGSTQEVVLHAFGQDAYFHVKEIITTSTTWLNDKPHVIYGYCALDSGLSLTIPAGTKVHSYNSSFLYIYKSSLFVNGTLGNEVEFSQTRNEDFILAPADSVAGQWRGIYFFAPKNSSLNYATIKNAVIGVQIDTLSGQDSVALTNVKIDNSVYAAILTQGGNVFAQSCLFGNAGSYSGFFSIGGKVFVDHCTFGNYWLSQRNSALLVIKDYYEDANENIQYRPFVSNTIKNSIIYGPNENECVLDTLSRTLSGVAPKFFFSHCLFKTENNVANSSFYFSCWKNLDPNFVNTSTWNYRSSGSAVDNKGTTTIPIPDLDGVMRSISGNRLGAYN
jgi:hypothetical protein